MSKFCPKCGAEVSEEAIVCPKCGAALGAAKANATNEIQPKAWLVEAILVTLFCCLPLGIAGIVNAANVSSRFAAGDIEGAKRASEQAGKWVKWSFWLGLIGIVIYFAIMIFTGVLAGMAAGLS